MGGIFIWRDGKMDTENNGLIKQASDMYTQGDKEKAKLLLATVINNDPNNAKAWYGMALCLDDEEKKVYCLKKALELKPGNKAIQHEIQKISKQPKTRKISILGVFGACLILCVVSSIIIAGLSYYGYYKNPENNNIAAEQGIPITATIDGTALSQIVGTEYASSIQAYAPINATSTIAIMDTAIPTLTSIPDTETPAPAILPILPIIANETTTCIPQNERVSGIVTRIIDGDTIEVAIGENAYIVRYIGIDCPEVSSPQDTYGIGATQKNKDLVFGNKVILIKDVSETDQYGRLLRYIFVDDIFVNYELVAQGYATSVAYQPDIACLGTFLFAEQSARNAQIGLWAPVPILIPTISKSNNINCDPAYPTVCIASSPPDLDCKDITYRNFKVLPPDPHNFDGNDNDGIGCEEN